MTGDNSTSDTEQSVVPVSALEGLIEGWQSKVSRQDFDGSAEEYQAYMDAHESCVNDVVTVIEQFGAGDECDLHTDTEQSGGDER